MGTPYVSGPITSFSPLLLSLTIEEDNRLNESNHTFYLVGTFDDYDPTYSVNAQINLQLIDDCSNGILSSFGPTTNPIYYEIGSSMISVPFS